MRVAAAGVECASRGTRGAAAGVECASRGTRGAAAGVECPSQLVLGKVTTPEWPLGPSVFEHFRQKIFDETENVHFAFENTAKLETRW